MKDFAAHSLRHVSFLVDNPCPVEHAQTQLELIAYCVAVEDYEGAKGIKDAVREFFNELYPALTITTDALLRLPEYRDEPVYAHLSYGSKPGGH